MTNWIQKYQEDAGNGLKLNRVVITPESPAQAQAIYTHLTDTRILDEQTKGYISFAGSSRVTGEDMATIKGNKITVKSWSMELAQKYLEHNNFGKFEISK